MLEAFKNRRAIWEGFRNKVFKQEHVEAVYESRLEICKGCEFVAEKGTELCAIPGTGPCCPECGCSWSIKLRTLSMPCPKNKWEAIMTAQEEELLNRMLNEDTKGTRGSDDSKGSQTGIQDGISSDKG